MRIRWMLVIGALLLVLPAQAWSQEPLDVTLYDEPFGFRIRPLLLKYCGECHSADRAEGEINLAEFSTLADVRKDPRTWQKVWEMLRSKQMPPPDARQPTADEGALLRGWVLSFLSAEAKKRAGDPGRVVLRRLSNAEYTFTLRDLTGVTTLDPAREFPVDGAAGEGFTNTGNALVMSPALITKYLNAAKEVAGHAVLLPDGFRFSPSATRSDWTNEILAEIREFYRTFTDPRGGDKVNLQGIVFDTNTGGRLPVEKYLAATLEERTALQSGQKTIAAIARDRGLNEKYLTTLWERLTQPEATLVLESVRARWRTAKPEDAAAIGADVAQWQKSLWKFASVGHIGKVGGPQRWMEPVDPLVQQQELHFKIPASTDGSDVTLALVASDAGDGTTHDFVVWQQPRLVAPGRPDLLLRDVREVTRELAARRAQVLAHTARFLAAADEAAGQQGQADAAQLAEKHGIDLPLLRAWLDYLGIGSGGAVELRGHFTEKLASAANYDFIQGWGSHQTPLLLANSSDQHVRVPGNMPPHTVAVHPSPTLRAVVGWRSPVTATLRVSGTVTHAHPECGNGVAWWLELRRGATRQRLAAGNSQGGKPVTVGPIEDLAIQTGDLVSLLIGPRDANHACDLTTVDLQLAGPAGQAWRLADDVSGNILAGNPHADRQGNAAVWHFYTEPEKAGDVGPVIPADSLLAKWRSSASSEERRTLAMQVEKLLNAEPPAAQDSPDAQLHRQLVSLGGPLFSGLLRDRSAKPAGSAPPESPLPKSGIVKEWGPDPALFGKRPNGTAIDAASLCVRAPAVIEFLLPADLVAGFELVTNGTLDQELGAEGSVQVDVIAGKPAQAAGLLPSEVTVTVANGQWTADNRRTSYGRPIVTNPGSAARQRIETAFADFRRLFPAALCYTKIVPVDEVVTLTLFYREDDHLMRLMLDESQQAQLDRLWDELHYVSQDALTLVDAFAQLLEYASQDADPKVFEPMRKPINDRAAAYRQRLVDTEPRQLDALLDFAAQAYRRPLADAESQELRQLYARLRTQELPHEEAWRLTLARMLISPAFLYRIEKPGVGTGQGPVSAWELANRLSYFAWSSQPDDELRGLAAAGRLQEPEILAAQTQRLLRDGRTRRLATEFACQWLHIHGFDQLDEKSERHFPSFAGLRGAMYEESIQFFTDLFQNNGSILDILDADHTFLNEDLARHYAVPGVTGPEWRRVEGVKKYQRGGILAQATTLSMQSGASRTSPILRGNWISEVLLGERLPRPPKGVPQLPDDETDTAGLTVRELVEKHSSDVKCAICHRRIDPFGFSLEAFDAIGRRREKDLGDRPIDTRVKALDGAEFEDLNGLREYLLTVRRDAFVRQFCRKLLGYALGREVQLSDEPLLTEMRKELESENYRVMTAIQAITGSRQFREIRGRETAYEE